MTATQQIKEPTETEQIIAGMMKENTGKHFLDSGGDLGRSWQRNQCREFSLEQESVLKWDYDYLSVTHNLYHWLVDRLEFSSELSEAFNEFSAKQEDTHYLEDMEAWATEIGGAGIYCEGNPITVNTYNGECLLSQVIQFTYFELEDADAFEDATGGSYVLLQIHGGADVRGGYTAPQVFQVCDGSEGLGMFDNARGAISCNREKNESTQTEIPGLEIEPCEMYWYSDDGHSWYAEGTAGHGAGTQLEKYETTKADDDEVWTKGKVHVCEDDSILCPCCGSTMSVGFY
jgi:hypothetical protein